ncbi:MAG: DUF4365 domain-containing protein [Chloroflexi bacterium]|nr:DUF4365 domain-containing protein [Chloroflexota bacterium]
MPDHSWERLNPLQVGRYAEYLVKMEFTRLGFSVFGAEVDDRGIDMVVRTDAAQYFDVQVKSSRKLSYIFLSKDKFEIAKNVLAAIVIFFEGEPPRLFLIPSTAWKNPDALLRDRDYGSGRKSKPEWGINVSRRNLPLLDRFAFEKIAQRHMT